MLTSTMHVMLTALPVHIRISLSHIRVGRRPPVGLNKALFSKLFIASSDALEKESEPLRNNV